MKPLPSARRRPAGLVSLFVVAVAATAGVLFAGQQVVIGVSVAAAAPVLGADQAETNPRTAPAGDQEHKKVVLTHNSATNSYDFETDEIQGSIRLDGAYHGVTRLVDKRTLRQVIAAKLSALNLYRLMSVGQVLGMPRTMERTVHVSSHWVEAKWAPAAAPQDEVAARRQVGEITARYEVVEPNAIDVTVTVRSTGTFSGFEVFMPSYFEKVMRPHAFLQPHGFGRGAEGREPELVVPTVNDVFRGTLLVFPRDDHAARRCLDGRWDRMTEIQVCPVRHYGYCLALLTDPDKQMGAVLMAHPRHCWAISTRYHADNDADRLTPYSAFDVSLFGDDLAPGDQRTAKVRLALTPLDHELSQPRKLYEAFIAETNDQLDQPPTPSPQR